MSDEIVIDYDRRVTGMRIGKGAILTIPVYNPHKLCCDFCGESAFGGARMTLLKELVEIALCPACAVKVGKFITERVIE